MSLEFIMAGDTPATAEQRAFLRACNQLLQTGFTRFALAGWGSADPDIDGFSAFCAEGPADLAIGVELLHQRQLDMFIEANIVRYLKMARKSATLDELEDYEDDSEDWDEDPDDGDDDI